MNDNQQRGLWRRISAATIEYFHWIIIPLLILASLILVSCLLIVLEIDVPFIRIGLSLTPMQRAQLLPSVAISCAAVVAGLAYVRELRKQKEESERNTSRALLEQAEKGFKEVRLLLKEIPNTRIIWIRAARALLKAVELGKEIKSPEYIKAFNLLTERTRNDLYLLLTTKDSESGIRRPLPAKFFYGIPDWIGVGDTDDAAIQASSRRRILHTPNIDDLPPETTEIYLDRKSIIAIYDFIEFPPDYVDPLDKVNIWTENWETKRGISAGARRYVAHRQESKNKFDDP